MDSISLNLDNLTPDEREQLMKLVEKGNKVESKSKVWKPVDGEGYWTFNTMDGYVDDSSWYEDGDDLDVFRYSIGLVYRTKEEAEFAIERTKVLTELQRYALEYNVGEIAWSDDETDKFCIVYNHSEKIAEVSSNCWIEHSSTYFVSRATAENAIKAIGKDRIKKYLFNIEN